MNKNNRKNKIARSGYVYVLLEILYSIVKMKHKEKQYRMFYGINSLDCGIIN